MVKWWWSDGKWSDVLFYLSTLFVGLVEIPEVVMWAQSNVSLLEQALHLIILFIHWIQSEFKWATLCHHGRQMTEESEALTWLI